jgi:hypothetical protein
MPGREIYGDLMAIPEAFALSDFGDLALYPEEALDSAGPNEITLADFEEYLLKRSLPEEAYGMFSEDVTMCRFRGTKNGESILADIEQKNVEQGMGNVEIPNTNIRLINYSVCPKCGKVFSFKELGEYYRRPKSDSRFTSLANQARNDTRVCCPDCDTWFLPTLIIADETPKNEVQFLCRNQTMDAVENYFMAMGKQVLTKKNGNVLTDSTTGLKAVKNDAPLNEMAQKPTLIANMLQYTPANLALNLMDGSNIEKGDVLYGWWGKRLAS